MFCAVVGRSEGAGGRPGRLPRAALGAFHLETHSDGAVSVLKMEDVARFDDEKTWLNRREHWHKAQCRTIEGSTVPMSVDPGRPGGTGKSARAITGIGAVRRSAFSRSIVSPSQS